MSLEKLVIVIQFICVVLLWWEVWTNDFCFGLFGIGHCSSVYMCDIVMVGSLDRVIFQIFEIGHCSSVCMCGIVIVGSLHKESKIGEKLSSVSLKAGFHSYNCPDSTNFKKSQNFLRKFCAVPEIQLLALAPLSCISGILKFFLNQ